MNKKTTDRSQLVLLISNDINAGVLPTGSWLKQIDLEQRYGATRLDIRRALDQLVQKNMVEHIPNRGYYVHTPDLTQVSDTREVRIALECAAVDQMVVTEERLQALDLIAQRFARLVNEGTMQECYIANLEFHRGIYDMCTNRVMIEFIEEIRSRPPSSPGGTWRTHLRAEQSGREHFQILDALRNGDRDRLKQLIAAHIRQTPLQP
ncbi:GntR family transcriptional regulator [Pseudomonas sp. PB101]|uniref:GntR family transcriptional regulator n=1 Tax=Pseudomonas sp. PB101 TaxID=2495428 RepID=UPI0015B44D0A|nr:GntR family transcriptional regulator [Pseudomonas sp. PB101]